MKDFLTRSFQKNEILRVDAQTLLNHAWMKHLNKDGEIGVDDITSQLNKHKMMMNSAEEAKQTALPTIRARRARQNRSRTISYSILSF